jgi:hypothetical protein
VPRNPVGLTCPNTTVGTSSNPERCEAMVAASCQPCSAELAVEQSARLRSIDRAFGSCEGRSHGDTILWLAASAESRPGCGGWIYNNARNLDISRALYVSRFESLWPND